MDMEFLIRLKTGEKFFCQCCGRWTQAYKRQIHHSIARSLISLYHIQNTGYEREYFHTSKFCKTDTGSDFAIAKHWGLIEAAQDVPEGKRTSGFWRITPKGKLFVTNKDLIKKYALIYDDRLLGFDGKDISITDCLGKKFNYDQLMAGV